MIIMQDQKHNLTRKPEGVEMSEKEKRISDIEERAYDMFPRKHKPSKYAEPDSCFPMYSYERAATTFWRGFISRLVDLGLSDAEIEALLRSKVMRRMFDAREDDLERFAGSLVTDYMIESARLLAGDE